MKLAIVGSTKWYHIDMPSHCIFNVIQGIITVLQPELVISGRSPFGGVDHWTEQCTLQMGLPFWGFPPERNAWSAFKARNIQIAEACDFLVSIRSSTSTTYGSGWTADYAEKLGKPVRRLLL